jgi:hypothetical protein
MAERNWLVCNVIGGSFAGIAGLLVLFFFGSFLETLFSLQNCSGFPCDNRFRYVFAVAGVSGGFTGGIVYNVVTCFLAKRTLASNPP